MSIVGLRYASSQILEIWSAETKVLKERELWIAVLRAQMKHGLGVSTNMIAAYERAKGKIDLKSIEKRESILKHDVKARIEEFNSLAGHQGIHLGLTSRDVTENIEGWQISTSLELVFISARQLLEEFAEKIEKYSNLVIVGRTHNVPAQSTTLGRRFAYWSEEFLLALENLNHVYKNYKIKGIKGALGTGSDLKLILGTKWNSVEKEIGKELGIESILTAPSQIYPRSLDFQVVSSLVQLAAPVASIATNVRLMAGLGLINEGRSSDQIGSSAMPHKNNPRLCERIGGLYILLKGYLSMISEITGNQWNEGDVSESVVRRVALAESFYAIDATLRTMRKVLMELEVNEQEIALEIETELQYLLSSEVLVMATKKGKGREAAHQIILECARKSKLSGKDSFFDLLARDGALNLSLTELEDLISRLEINVGDAPEQAQKVLEQIKSEISKLAEFKDIKLDDISN